VKLINVEKKLVDYQLSASADTTPIVQNLAAIDQGDAQHQRSGNSIRPQYITVKGSCSIHGSSTTALLRYVILQDKQQVADTAPSYTDVFESASPVAFMKKTSFGRYSILKDMLIPLGSQENQIQKIDFTMQLNGHIFFNGSATSDIQRNGLWLMVVSDQASNAPGILVNHRMRFTDN